MTSSYCLFQNVRKVQLKEHIVFLLLSHFSVSLRESISASLCLSSALIPLNTFLRFITINVISPSPIPLSYLICLFFLPSPAKFVSLRPRPLFPPLLCQYSLLTRRDEIQSNMQQSPSAHSDLCMLDYLSNSIIMMLWIIGRGDI